MLYHLCSRWLFIFFSLLIAIFVTFMYVTKENTALCCLCIMSLYSWSMLQQITTNVICYIIKYCVMLLIYNVVRKQQVNVMLQKCIISVNVICYIRHNYLILMYNHIYPDIYPDITQILPSMPDWLIIVMLLYFFIASRQRTSTRSNFSKYIVFYFCVPTIHP